MDRKPSSEIKIEMPRISDVVCAVPATVLFFLMSGRVLIGFLNPIELPSGESSSGGPLGALIVVCFTILGFLATGALWLLVLTPTWVSSLRDPKRELVKWLVIFGTIMSVGVYYFNLSDIMTSFLTGDPPREDVPRLVLLGFTAIAPLRIVSRSYLKWSWTRFILWLLLLSAVLASLPWALVMVFV